MFYKTLKQAQPVAVQILENSLKKQQLSHAYLFNGSRGSLTKEAAILLAQTMICQQKTEVFACETCNDCRRIKENNYADLIIIDGANRNIKKEEILDLQSRFMQTSLEQAGKKVYIIHQVENATPEALNSLLKFLEEPESKDMLAILTSENSDQLLPTVLSRTQMIPFASQGVNQLEPLLKEDIDNDLDRYLIAHIVSDVSSAITMHQDEAYGKARDTFKEFLTHFHGDILEANVYLQKEGFNFKSKDIKQVVELFCQIAYIFFKDSAYQNIRNVNWWDQAIEDTRLRKISLDAMKIFNEGKDKIQTNANMNLLVDQMLFALDQIP